MNAVSQRAGRGGDRKTTGRTVILALGLGFGVMFAANFALIYAALSTLHGEELENPYDASQAYNQRLGEARAQDKLGWSVNLTTRQENGGVKVVADIRDRDGSQIPGLDVHARFVHPFDRGQDRDAALADDGGDYEGFASGPHDGRWTLAIEAKQGERRKFYSENKLALTEQE